MIMNYCDLLDRVQSVTKTKQDDDVTNRIGVVFAENNTKLSWWINLGEVSN